MSKTDPGATIVSHYILRLPQVKARTGLSRSTIYLRLSRKTFPQPISLGDRAVGWLESDIEDWLEEQITKSRAQGAMSNESR